MRRNPVPIRPTKLKPTTWYGKFTRQLAAFKSESGAILVEFPVT